MPSSFFTGCYSSMTLPASCMWPPPCAPPSVCLFFLLFFSFFFVFFSTNFPLRSFGLSLFLLLPLRCCWGPGLGGMVCICMHARHLLCPALTVEKKESALVGSLKGNRLCLVLRVQGVGWLPCTLLTFERERKASFRWPSLPFFGVLLLLFDAQPGRANPLAPRGGKSNLHSVIN